MDTRGIDLLGLASLAGSPHALGAECNRRWDCAGFTTSGWLKAYVPPAADAWLTGQQQPFACAGLYVRLAYCKCIVCVLCSSVLQLHPFAQTFIHCLISLIDRALGRRSLNNCTRQAP